MSDHILPIQFYHDEPVTVARNLLGKLLVRDYNGRRLTGVIVETEAYLSTGDQASHAYSKAKGCYRKTTRNATMFGPAGRAYVYVIMGLHHCLNIVTEAEGCPSAILIRAVKPLDGIDVMQKRRRLGDITRLARGPGNLCNAFAIDRTFDGWDLTQGKRLWVTTPEASSSPAGAVQIRQSPRLGVTRATTLPLRFFLDSEFVSGSRKRA